MDPNIAEFARDAGHLIRIAEEDTTDALCAITRTQHSFEAAAAGLRDRLGRIPVPTPAVSISPVIPMPEGRKITRRELSLVWLLLVAAACMAFALGYVMALPPGQRFRSRSR